MNKSISGRLIYSVYTFTLIILISKLGNSYFIPYIGRHSLQGSTWNHKNLKQSPFYFPNIEIRINMISDDDDDIIPSNGRSSKSIKKDDLKLLDSMKLSNTEKIDKKPTIQYYVGKSAKYVVSSIVAIILLLSSSPLPLYYTLVSTINSTLGKVLKQLIKQPRPALAHKTSYGMPSTHSLAVVYFCTVIIGKANQICPDKVYLRTALIIGSLLYSVLACTWRITSHLHTTSQVLAGSLMGFSAACIALLLESSYLFWLKQVESRTLFPIRSLVTTTLALATFPLIFKKEIRKVKEFIRQRAGWK